MYTVGGCEDRNTQDGDTIASRYPTNRTREEGKKRWAERDGGAWVVCRGGSGSAGGKSSIKLFACMGPVLSTL